ncbi:hypothetical protein SPBR_03576 [Sporothrix brasiliensis 5110]|uniref:AAA+ ATPase domain-containing protein n=1 Tax=Sporothrix brasiliensis 5110 TaxID=1398154 RepID=A0A0C2JDH0_9PEZI|nr:uncharacterized protein SPBR_03576 [Sporothrix brasiliensis 5110]KIH94997.1 hypothetical protein SPBR_03576 [Sporothrix brasiliensis 5110]
MQQARADKKGTRYDSQNSPMRRAANRARALQSVAAAPKQYRRRIIPNRPTLGAVRGFIGSPARSARTGEPNPSRDDEPRPQDAASGGKGASEGSGPSQDTWPTTSTSVNTAAGQTTPFTPPAPTVPTVPIPESEPATATQSADGPKETFSVAVGIGGGRNRAARTRNQDGMPAITLPDWFLTDRVRLYREDHTTFTSAQSLSSDLEAASNLIFPTPPQTSSPDDTDLSSLSIGDRETLHRYFDAWVDGASWDAHKVAQAAAHLRDGQQIEAVARRGAAIAAAASYAVASIAYHGPGEFPLPLENVSEVTKTAQISRLDPDNALSLPHRPFGKPSKEAIKASLEKGSPRSIAMAADSAIAHGIPTRTDFGEYLVFQELYSTVATELGAVSPAKSGKDSKRPVSVLAIMNYKGRSKAVNVIDDVARALSAHVVHLDAGSIANIAGPYLGQTAYWARGNIAMLGYSAALKNGQTVSRSLPNSDDDSDVSLSRIPVSIMRVSGMSRLPMKGFATSEPDDRWDDLKINNVLEAMVRAADATSLPSSSLPSSSPLSPQSTKMTPTATKPHNLILHVHHFLELSSTIEGTQILTKLRNIVDRLWQKGRKIVLVGSTSADMNANPSLLERAEDLRQEDCHVIPYRVAEGTSTRNMEAQDTFNENMSNIRAMISALTSQQLNLNAFAWPSGVNAELKSALSSTIFDIHWVYRFAAQVIGNSGYMPSPQPSSHAPALSSQLKDTLNEHSFLRALRSTQDQDKMWKETTGAQEPYYSPLTVNQETDAESEPTHEVRIGGILKKVSSSDYTEYEKKFLSDLIDANEIKTTFDDIVIPTEVKESLKALTSLSLIRPEAFLYGVLAAERIPGCLLYGPPGTGKTLMAKAVAKQSGANMLEISAASINDMWVGNSEKNVQGLFSLARKLSPVVIFLDEADALLGARQTRPGRGGHRETINQFLREWDGLASNMKAFIMVATNRPFDLDEAVLRRLPRRLLVDLPLRESRLAILRVMLRDEMLDSETVSLEKLAADTELYSGSDLKNLCVAAAMAAVREEVRAQAAHTGPDPFVFPERRVLSGRHFDRALQEIGASISEDMASLQAIRRFDERYGDNSSKRRRKRQRGMGFEVAKGPPQTEEARVRQPA